MGGKLVQGVSPIRKENIMTTLENVQKIINKLHLYIDDCRIVGSAWKKEESGDLDIVVGLNEFGLDKIHEDKQKLFDIFHFALGTFVGNDLVTRDIQKRPALNLISASFPIVGDSQKGEYVQVDFLITEDIDLSEWFYFAPNESTSQYTSSVRNELLHMVAKYADTSVDGWVSYNNFQPTFKRYWLSPCEGLMHGTSTCISEKTGKETKTWRSVDKVKVDMSLKEIVHLLFGQDFSPFDLMTFENVLSAIQTFDRVKRDNIIREAFANIKRRFDVDIVQDMIDDIDNEVHDADFNKRVIKVMGK